MRQDMKERVLEVCRSTDTSTNLLIRNALTLRGIAMELGQVLSYTAYEQLTAMLSRNASTNYLIVSIDRAGGLTSSLLDRCTCSRE